jgi:glycosidase
LFGLIACLALALSACIATPTPAPAPDAPTPPPMTPTAAPPSATPAPAASATPEPTPAPTGAPLPKPTLTPDARPAIDTPAWFNDATVYQIFPRSFRDSDGDGIGDLNGITQQLDYIQSLGANTLWLTPFYPSATYHGYDVADYVSVNPEFGDEEDFKNLAAEAHARGMKVLVDFVANHSSDTHPYFKDALGNPQSQYTSWYRFNDQGNLTYDSFFGIANLPEWNHGNQEVNEYLIDAALHWLDLGADGLRADYAKGVEPEFWQALRQRVKAAHPDAVLLGEVWDSNAFVLQSYFKNGFDALFDFPWYTALSDSHDRNGDGVLNGAIDPRLLWGPYRALQQTYPPGAQIVRFASNHDTNRIASDVEGDVERMKLAAAATFLSPGIPILYYGEEIGMRGVKGGGPIYDEYRREPMDWYAGETGEGMPAWFKPADRNNKPADGVSVEEQDEAADSLLNTYRSLAKLRNDPDHPSLRSTQFQVMEKVEGCPTCLGLWRWADDEVTALFFNFGEAEHSITFDAAAQSPVPLGEQVEFIFGETNSMAGLVIKSWGTIVMRWR